MAVLGSWGRVPDGCPGVVGPGDGIGVGSSLDCRARILSIMVSTTGWRLWDGSPDGRAEVVGWSSVAELGRWDAGLDLGARVMITGWEVVRRGVVTKIFRPWISSPAPLYSLERVAFYSLGRCGQ